MQMIPLGPSLFHTCLKTAPCALFQLCLVGWEEWHWHRLRRDGLGLSFTPLGHFLLSTASGTGCQSTEVWGWIKPSCWWRNWDAERPSGLSRCEGSMAEVRGESSGFWLPVLFHRSFCNLCLVSSYFINWEFYSKFIYVLVVLEAACYCGGNLALDSLVIFGVTRQLG